MFYIDSIDNKKILKSSLLSEFSEKFKHIFTTRESFIKTKAPALHNTAKANRDVLLRHLNITSDSLIEINQTHSANIAIEAKTPDFIDNTDGIILYKPGSATILNFADCTPIILYDTKNNILAGLHGGWRGTAGRISALGVKLMKEKFNSHPGDIIAAIGPCIGQEDFEAGMEVHKALKDSVKDNEGLFKFRNDKVFSDLAKINARQLSEEGVKTIDTCHFKTYKDNDLFFSYRRENGTTNRISLILSLVK